MTDMACMTVLAGCVRPWFDSEQKWNKRVNGRLTGEGLRSYFAVIMPEPYWPKRKKYLLSQAMEHSRFGMMRCPYCKRERYFWLKDMMKIFGDIDCDAISDQHRWRCQGCNGTMNLGFRVQDPPAAGGVIVRNLSEIYYVKRVVWRDERR